MEAHSELVGELETALAHPRSGDFPHRFENALTRLLDLGDAALVEPLLGLFEDEADPRHMFALVHMVERLGGPVYLDHLLVGLPALASRSPYWAETLLIRVLNSASTLRDLEQRLSSLLTPQTSALRSSLTQLAASAPEFVDRVELLLGRLDASPRLRP